MDFSYDNYSRTRIGFFVCAYGINRYGERVVMVISKDHTASGCYPYYWDHSPHNRHGYEFATRDAALESVKFASNYNSQVRSIEEESIRVWEVEINISQTMKIVE